MKIYCNCKECPYIKQLDSPVDYMPHKGYKPLHEYKFYGECDSPSADKGCMCGWSCSKCLFDEGVGCLKDEVFIDKSGEYCDCKCFSNRFFSGHMDFSKLGRKKDMF